MSAMGIVMCTHATVTAQAPAPPDSIWLLVDAAVEADESGRTRILRDLEAAARAALAGNEGSVERRYALAVVLGARANTEGGQTRVRAASELHEHLVAILNADPGHVGARHLLGRLHAGVRRMSTVTRWIATNLLGGNALRGATWKAAEENLAYAEAQNPDVPDHHLQLALLYRDTNRPALAAVELQHVLDLPVRSARDAAARAEAVRLRGDLRD